MSLIKCPKCGREISDRALKCFGCGMVKEDLQVMSEKKQKNIQIVKETICDAKPNIDNEKINSKEYSIEEIVAYPTLSLVFDSDKIDYPRSEVARGKRICGESRVEDGKSEYDTCKEGDVVRFGKYADQPIEWLVLKKENNRILLISKNILDIIPYNKTRQLVKWEESYLRRYLNSEFVEKSFSKEEKLCIDQVFIKKSRDKVCRTMDNNETLDKVFCLSLSEVCEYFECYKDRMAIPTDYAKGKVTAESMKRFMGIRTKGASWWLRSMGLNGVLAAFVSGNGFVKESGNVVDSDYCGIRPALWIKLNC